MEWHLLIASTLCPSSQEKAHNKLLPKKTLSTVPKKTLGQIKAKIDKTGQRKWTSLADAPWVQSIGMRSLGTEGYIKFNI